MSPVPFVTRMDYAQNVYVMMNEILPIFSVVQAALAAEMILNPGWATTDLTEDERNDTLRLLTGLTVALSPTLNCYPRGLAETTCFDIDGNEVP